MIAIKVNIYDSYQGEYLHVIAIKVNTYDSYQGKYL